MESVERAVRELKADRMRLLHTLALTHAALDANEAKTEALESGCLPSMRDILEEIGQPAMMPAE